jgi:prepilin-type N-terminal cleavage/methylation domain-containing protein
MKEYFKKQYSVFKKILRETCLLKSQAGISLIETLVAIAILGIIVVGSLVGLCIATKAFSSTNVRQKAITLAEYQMEYVKNQGYLTTYTPAPISNEYTSYSVSIDTANVTSRDLNIQEIDITVSHQGNPIIMVPSANCTLMDFKVNQ